MQSEQTALIGKVAVLHGRVMEAGKRMRQDALLFLELEQELSSAIETLCAACREPKPPAPISPTSGPRMLRIAEVSKRVGLARSSIWQLVKERHFPQAHRLSTRAVGWFDVEIDEWLGTRQLANSAKRKSS